MKKTERQRDHALDAIFDEKRRLLEEDEEIVLVEDDHGGSHKRAGDLEHLGTTPKKRTGRGNKDEIQLVLEDADSHEGHEEAVAHRDHHTHTGRDHHAQNLKIATGPAAASFCTTPRSWEQGVWQNEDEKEMKNRRTKAENAARARAGGSTSAVLPPPPAS
ncbi:unnamed protein product, partial [Amoebophrya sp. A25]|eukprot:GSA25T00018369001.1